MWQWQTFTLIKIGHCHWFRKTCRTLTLSLSLSISSAGFNVLQRCLASCPGPTPLTLWPFDLCLLFGSVAGSEARWWVQSRLQGWSTLRVQDLHCLHILGALTRLIELYPSRSSRHSMANIFTHFFCWGVPTAVSFCVRFAKFDVEPWTQVGSFGIFGFSDRISCIPNWKSFGCPPLPYQGWSKTSIRGLWWWQQLGSGQRKSEWKPVQQLPVLLVLRALLV